MPLYNNLKLFCKAGVPGLIEGAGPRMVLESHAERADERLNLEDLPPATRAAVRALSDLLVKKSNQSCTKLE
jgi:hypothetical protein